MEITSNTKLDTFVFLKAPSTNFSESIPFNACLFSQPLEIWKLFGKSSVEWFWLELWFQTDSNWGMQPVGTGHPFLCFHAVSGLMWPMCSFHIGQSVLPHSMRRVSLWKTGLHSECSRHRGRICTNFYDGPQKSQRITSVESQVHLSLRWSNTDTLLRIAM